MADLESMKRDLLSEFEDDHVGLWAVLGYVEDELPQAGDALIRKTALDLLKELLEAKQIQAGFPAPNGRDFRPWSISPTEVIHRIETNWKPGSPRPRPGEVVWFTTPSKPTVPS